MSRCHATRIVFGTVLKCLAAVMLLAGPALADGQFGKVIRVDKNAFSPGAGKITFSEYRTNTRNPAYTPKQYGGDGSGPNVTFGGFFSGQRMGARNECPAGAALTGCVVGRPVTNLSFAPRAPVTFVANDTSNPTSPSLSGSPRFNGPVSILFDRDLAGVGLVGGFFNSVQSTAITVFDRNGNQIGGVKNVGTGMEYLALVTEDGRNTIAGLQFSLVGAEQAGFAIDELSFAYSSQMAPAVMNKLGLKEVLSDVESKSRDAVVKKSKAKQEGGLGALFDKVDSDVKKKPPAKSGSIGDLFKD